MLNSGSGTLGPYQRPAVGTAAGRGAGMAAMGDVNLMTPNGRRPGDCG